MPLRAINKVKGEGTAKAVYLGDFANFTPEVEGLVRESDIVIVQRVVVNDVLSNIIKTKLKYGKTVAVDLDDAYSKMPHMLRAYDFWFHGKVVVDGEDGKDIVKHLPIRPIEQLQWGVKLANAVTSPNRLILEDWKALTPNTYLVPNYIDANFYIPFRKKERNGRLVIGWGGSGSHWLSWLETHIIPAIRRVLSERRDVEFLLAGAIYPIVEKIERKLPQNSRVKWIDWSPISMWPSTLSQIDIGLMPLYGEYDERRSPLKIIEYDLMGIPWIGSRNGMTEEFAEHGTLVNNRTNDWYEAIMQKIDQYSLEKERMGDWSKWAEEQDIEKNVDKIMATYEEIRCESWWM